MSAISEGYSWALLTECTSGVCEQSRAPLIIWEEVKTQRTLKSSSQQCTPYTELHQNAECTSEQQKNFRKCLHLSHDVSVFGKWSVQCSKEPSLLYALECFVDQETGY